MRRPDVFTLDYSHPLAQGLVRAFFFNERSGNAITDLALRQPTVFAGNVQPTWQYDGLKLNGAIGTTSFVHIANGPVIGNKNSCSVFAVTKNNAYLNGSGETIYAERSPSGSDIFKLQMGGAGYTRGPYAHFIWRDDANNLMEIVGGNISGGDSHSVCLVLDGTSVNLYADGVATSPATRVVGSFTNSNIVCRVGSDVVDQYSSNSDGVIEQLLLYNRALSPAEIAILADRTDPMLGGLIVEERPVLYFPLTPSGTPYTIYQDMYARISWDRAQTQDALAKISTLKNLTQDAKASVSMIYSLAQDSFTAVSEDYLVLQDAQATISEQVGYVVTQDALAQIHEAYSKVHDARAAVSSEIMVVQDAQAVISEAVTYSVVQDCLVRVSEAVLVRQDAISKVATTVREIHDALVGVSSGYLVIHDGKAVLIEVDFETMAKIVLPSRGVTRISLPSVGDLRVALTSRNTITIVRIGG